MSRRELLAKLIKMLHLSVDERRQMVLPITAAELEAIVVQELMQECRLSSPVGSIVKPANGEYQLYREWRASGSPRKCSLCFLIPKTPLSSLCGG